MICTSPTCSEQFTQNRSTHLHCSKSCRERDNRRKASKPKRSCAYCRQTFNPTRGVSKYCSDRCRGFTSTHVARLKHQAIHGIQCALSTCNERFHAQQVTQKYCGKKCKHTAQTRRVAADLADRRRLESLNPAHANRLAYLLDCQSSDVRPRPAQEHGRMFSEPLRKAAA